jgi:hypothetical protein
MGRIIRDLNDAASFAREQEVRSGVEQRDEVLHNIERAGEPGTRPCCSTLVRAVAGGVGRARIVVRAEARAASGPKRILMVWGGIEWLLAPPSN